MRFVKVLASIVFSLIIIIALVGYFAVRNFDLNKYKSFATEMVEQQTGRHLAINGDARIGISLTPTVDLNDVELSNPEWAKNPQMLKVKQLEVKFAIIPLLKKQVVIDKVNLIAPEIYLEKAKDGVASWTFKTSSPQAAAAAVKKAPQADKISAQAVAENPGAAALAGFAARNVTIENGLVNYFDAKTGKETNVKINQITMEAPAVDQQMTAGFDVTYNGQPIKGDLVLGALNSLLENKEPYPFKLTAEAFGVDFDLQGSAEDLMSAPRYAVLANIYNPAGNFNAPETTLKALADGDVNQADIKIQTLNIVNNLITGKVKAVWSGKVPSVDATLSSDKINLQNFSGNSNFALELPSIIGTAQAAEMVPATAVPYEMLKQVNAKANLSVKQLVISPGMQADNVVVKADLQNGVLKVNPLQLQFGGGNIDGNLTANANTRNIQLKLTSKNMLLQNLHKEFKVDGANDFGVLSGGNVDLDIDVSSNGSTYRQLVQNLNGQVIAIVDKSVIQTGALSFMSGNFISQLLGTLKIDTSKAEKLNLTCGVVRADLGSGKANFPKGIVLNAKELTLVSDGNINLVNDKIDFDLRPFSGKVSNTNVMQAISSLIKIKGTLQSPKIALDDKEALKTIVGVATTGGTAYLGSKLLLDADGSPCYTALKGTPYANRFPKPSGVAATTQNVYQETTDQVGKGLKAIINTPKDILKALKSPKKTSGSSN